MKLKFEIGLCQLRQAVVAAALAVLPTMAVADMPVVYKVDGRAIFGLSAPDFWQVRAGGERAVAPPGASEARLINRIIGFTPVADDGVWVGFMSPNGVSGFAEGRDYLRNIGRSVVSAPQVTGSDRIRIGGRAAERFTGTGRRNGRGVSFTAVLIDLPSNRMAISLTVIEAGADPDLVADVNAIYRSFRALQ